MKKIILFAFVILTCTGAGAQNIFSGYLIDRHTESSLPGVNVYIPDLQLGAVSNDEGYFEIRGIPDGILSVQFSFIGYKTRVLTLDFQGDKKDIYIELEADILLAEEVVISGGYYSMQDENAVKIEVIRRENLFRQGSPSYVEAISDLPGLSMISRGSGIGKPVIRGLSMNDVLVLNNGVRMENYQFGENHPLGLNEFGLEKIEVIKGPASLLYGSDAIGGVINFIPEKPAPAGKIVGDYNLAYHSNTLGINADLGIKASPGKWRYGVRAGLKDHADYMQANGDYAPNTRFNERSLKFNLGRVYSRGSFSLYYDFNDSKLGMLVPDVINEDLITERGRKLSTWYQDLRNQMIKAESKIFLGKFKLGATLAFQNNHRELYEEEDHPGVEMQLNTLSYDVKLRIPTDEQSDLIVGLQGMNQSNRNLHDRETIFLPDASISNYSLYFFARRMHWEKFHPQAGLRYDMRIIDSPEMEARGGHSHGEEEEHDGESGEEHQLLPQVDRSFGNISGSLGFTYYLTSRWLIRMNYAMGFRAPALSELTSNGLHAGRFEKGDPSLEAQRNQELDLSTHYHSSHITADLAMFYNAIHDYIYLSPTNDTAPLGGGFVYNYEQTNAKLYGMEADLHYHPKSLEWLHLKSSFESVRAKRGDGSNLPFIPADKLSGEVRFTISDAGPFAQIYINLRYQHVFSQDHPAQFESSSAAYDLLHAGLGGAFSWGKQKVNWGLNVNNLLDELYFDHLSTLKTMGIYKPGRNISLFFRIPFALK